MTKVAMMMIVTTRKMMTSVIIASPAFPTVDNDHHDADDKCHVRTPCISNYEPLRLQLRRT